MADSWEDIDEQELEKNIAEKIKSEQAKDQEQNFEKTDEWLREAHPYFAAKPTVQIMKRQTGPSNSNAPSGSSVASKPQMTIQEREANYAKARAAIFSGEDQAEMRQPETATKKPTSSAPKGSKSVNNRSHNKK